MDTSCKEKARCRRDPVTSNMQLREKASWFLSEQQICCMLILSYEFCGTCMNCRRLLSLYCKTNKMHTIYSFNFKNPKFWASLAYHQVAQLYKTIARPSLYGTVVRSSTYDVQRQICTHSLTYSQAQPMQGLGRLKKSPPTISILGLALPISHSQPLCILHHSIHPSKVWPSHSPSALWKTFQVPILKHRQVHLRLSRPRLILWVFVTSIFYRGRSSAGRPTPNLEDQSASLSLGHQLWPVQQGRPYQ